MIFGGYNFFADICLVGKTEDSAIYNICLGAHGSTMVLSNISLERFNEFH